MQDLPITNEEFLFAYLKGDYSNYYLKELAPHFRDAGILKRCNHKYEDSGLESWSFTTLVETKISCFHPGQTVDLKCLKK